MSKKGLFMKFHDGQYQFRVALVMYVDFEAILEPVEGSTPKPEMQYTNGINKHVPPTVSVCIAKAHLWESQEAVASL